jgi:hypothetical protein
MTLLVIQAAGMKSRSDEIGMKERIGFFVALGVVGGIVIGIAVGTDLSPVVAGLSGAVVTTLIMVLLHAVWGELNSGE